MLTAPARLAVRGCGGGEEGRGLMVGQGPDGFGHFHGDGYEGDVNALGGRLSQTHGASLLLSQRERLRVSAASWGNISGMGAGGSLHQYQGQGWLPGLATQHGEPHQL